MSGMGYAVMGTAIGRAEPRCGSRAGGDGVSAARSWCDRRSQGNSDQHQGLQQPEAERSERSFDVIQNAAHEDANIIFGAVLDEKMGDEVKITVIATGFRQEWPGRRGRNILETTLPSHSPVTP